jgi:hypothetical protein
LNCFQITGCNKKSPHQPVQRKANGGKKKEKKSYLEVSDILTPPLYRCKPSANKKTEPLTTLSFLRNEWFNLTLNMMTGSQEGKFRLKYVIKTFKRPEQTLNYALQNKNGRRNWFTPICAYVPGMI